MAEEKSLVNKDEKLKELARQLESKYSSKIIEDENGKHVLCNTDLAFEDEIWNGAYDLAKNMAICLKLYNEEKDDKCDDLFVDIASEVRDFILDSVLKGYNADIVFGYDEY